MGYGSSGGPGGIRTAGDTSSRAHPCGYLRLLERAGWGQRRGRVRLRAPAHAGALDHGGHPILVGPLLLLLRLSLGQAEAGDLRRFRHHRQFLKFCGMDLATAQSGMFRGQSRISKYGNARLRRTLWMAGQVAVLKRTNSFRDKFERYISRDRHNAHLRRKAYTAIAAKMARTVNAVVKHGEPCRPFFEGASPGGRTLV